MKFAKGKYTRAQRKWCQNFEDQTGFDPHAMGMYEAGQMTFVEAAKASVRWFEEWSNEVYLRITRDAIPGDDID